MNVEQIIEKDSVREFKDMPLDVQMKLLRGETVKDNKGNSYKLEMCLEGLHYKNDGSIEIIRGR